MPTFRGYLTNRVVPLCQAVLPSQAWINKPDEMLTGQFEPVMNKNGFHICPTNDDQVEVVAKAVRRVDHSLPLVAPLGRS